MARQNDIWWILSSFFRKFLSYSRSTYIQFHNQLAELFILRILDLWRTNWSFLRKIRRLARPDQSFINRVYSIWHLFQEKYYYFTSNQCIPFMFHPKNFYSFGFRRSNCLKCQPLNIIFRGYLLKGRAALSEHQLCCHSIIHGLR